MVKVTEKPGCPGENNMPLIYCPYIGKFSELSSVYSA